MAIERNVKDLAGKLKHPGTMPSLNRTFRFLDLPHEIRDKIYYRTLCIFSRFDSYTIDHYARIHARASFHQRRFLGTINLLLTCRQIYREGTEYMLKENLSVRIQCYGFNIRDYLHGHTPGISVLATDFKLPPSPKNRTSKFSWHAMHMWIGIERKANGEKRLSRHEYADIIVLWEDLEEFCKRFEIEGVVRSQADPETDPVKFVVQLNPCKIEEGTGRLTKGLRTNHFPRNIQDQLLRPIRDGLRSCFHLEIKGCAEEALVSEVTKSVSQPLWPSFDIFSTELEKHDSNVTEAWRAGDLWRCAYSCAVGISLILRLRASPFNLHLFSNRTPNVEGILLQWYFTFHFLFARCLHAHISTTANERVFPDDDMHIASTSMALSSMLSHCSNTDAHPDAPWHPTNHQKAEIFYMSSIAKRLRFERQFSAESYVSREVLRDIEMAQRCWPGNELFEGERKKVERWVEVVKRFEGWRAQRVLAGKRSLGVHGLGTGIEMMMLWRKEYDEWDAV